MILWFVEFMSLNVVFVESQYFFQQLTPPSSPKSQSSLLTDFSKPRSLTRFKLGNQAMADASEGEPPTSTL